MRIERAWADIVWWLLACEAPLPIRRITRTAQPRVRPGYLGSLMPRLGLDHTLWAVATYAMSRVALRARREPLRQVLVVLGLLAVPLMVLMYWWSFALD